MTVTPPQPGIPPLVLLLATLRVQLEELERYPALSDVAEHLRAAVDALEARVAAGG